MGQPARLKVHTTQRQDLGGRSQEEGQVERFRRGGEAQEVSQHLCRAMNSQQQQAKIQQFLVITGCSDSKAAAELLANNGWDVEKAIECLISVVVEDEDEVP